jgi:C1A family cysteine protease
MSDDFNTEIKELNESGYLYSREKVSEIAVSTNLEKFDKLPTVLDLRRYMTKIENQGQIGSCVANAVAGAYEYLVKRHKGELYDVSRLFIYYNARVLSGMAHKDEGAYVKDAIESLKIHGACSENTYPYIHELVNEKPSPEAYQEASAFLIESVEKIDTNLEAWKTILAQGYPIVFGLLLFESFDNYGHNGLIPIPSSKDHKRNSHAAHAMLCVGYSEHDKVFIVRNSWGKSWGHDGYCYIPYDYLINKNYNLGDNWIIKRLDNFVDNKDEYWSYNENSILENTDNSYNNNIGNYKDNFKWSNISFWSILFALLFFSFIQMKSPIFNGEDILKRYKLAEQSNDQNDKEDKNREKEDKEDIKPEKEETADDEKFYVWEWQNPYSRQPEKLEFSIKNSDYLNSIENRNTTLALGPRHVYTSLSQNDKKALESFILAIKENCRKKNLDYLQSLEYVIGAIQSIPYTLVTNGNKNRCPCTLNFVSYLDDCSAKPDANGCCNDIEPFAVFSPIEFVVQKTGDCDTRTLFAFTVLTALNYDVTILNSNAEGHSILGVNSSKPLGNGDYILGNNRKKYYVWELTVVRLPGIYDYDSQRNTWYSIFK